LINVPHLGLLSRERRQGTLYQLQALEGMRDFFLAGCDNMTPESFRIPWDIAMTSMETMPPLTLGEPEAIHAEEKLRWVDLLILKRQLNLMERHIFSERQAGEGCPYYDHHYVRACCITALEQQSSYLMKRIALSGYDKQVHDMTLALFNEVDNVNLKADYNALLESKLLSPETGIPREDPRSEIYDRHHNRLDPTQGKMMGDLRMSVSFRRTDLSVPCTYAPASRDRSDELLFREWQTSVQDQIDAYERATTDFRQDYGRLNHVFRPGLAHRLTGGQFEVER